MLVAGATGTIGAALCDALRARGHRVLATSRSGGGGRIALDLADAPLTLTLPEKIDVAYLLAAVTNMTACETDPAATRRINVEHTLALAERLVAGGAHLVYVSTNLVLAGDRAAAPLDSPLAPQCIYASQKAEVERRLLDGQLPASVLRVTKIAEGLDTLVGGWADRLSRGDTIAPFSDLVCAPMPAAAALEALIALGEQRLCGLHQIGADRDLSYAQIALALAQRMGVDTGLIRPTTSRAAGVVLPAVPRHTTLATTDSEHRLGIAPIRADDVVASLIERVLARRDDAHRAGPQTGV